jgi:hypothetical protein
MKGSVHANSQIAPSHAAPPTETIRRPDAGRYRRLASLLFALLPGIAAAQAPRPSAGEWQFELTPYLWAAGMKGSVEAGALPRVNVDMSFSDIFDMLDFGAMAAFEARKGRFSILTDAIYMKVSAGASASRTGPGPIGATATASANLRIEQTMLAAALAYRVSEGPTAVDVLGGARYNNIDATADIAGSFFALTASTKRSGDKGWTDPYVGVRIRHRLSDRWALSGYLDYGGFGVSSDSTWQAAAGGEYALSKTAALKFGYRELHIDYDKDGFVYDMKLRGAYIGVGIRF